MRSSLATLFYATQRVQGTPHINILPSPHHSTAMSNLMAELRALSALVKKIQIDVVALRQDTLPLCSAVALKAGLTTFSLALLIDRAGLLPTSVWNDLVQLNRVHPSAVINIQKSSHLRNRPRLHSLLLASQALAPVQPNYSIPQAHTHLLNRLRQDVCGACGKVEGNYIIDSLLATRIGGGVTHQMTLTRLQSIAKHHIGEEKSHNRPLSQEWRILRWLWLAVVRNRNFSVKSLTQADLSILAYNVSDPID
ncbi:hypothetical protein C8F04DRAFT_1097766 [Mycena alexandri]|uniref:Uncharacterized protein n=1 Tax=Mycena alexandri TaxID=1745969 RepID=A0AAD6X1N7_9AGAR|nr:hypothetical protein C8F04DRAFT_1097766 [Mycena alexandri]